MFRPSSKVYAQVNTRPYTIPQKVRLSTFLTYPPFDGIRTSDQKETHRADTERGRRGSPCNHFLCRCLFVRDLLWQAVSSLPLWPPAARRLLQLSLFTVDDADLIGCSTMDTPQWNLLDRVADGLKAIHESCSIAGDRNPWYWFGLVGLNFWMICVSRNGRSVRCSFIVGGSKTCPFGMGSCDKFGEWFSICTVFFWRILPGKQKLPRLYYYYTCA